MTGREYQKLAMRTNDGNATDRLRNAMEIFHLDKHCSEPNADIRNSDFGGILNA